MRPFGLLLILFALLAPIPWFLDLAARYPSAAIFSQYLGAAALIAMGVGQVLAARLPGSETIFGGLDRIYQLHKWLAVFAMVCLGVHDIIDAEIDGLGPETNLMDIAEEFGEIALYALLILSFITVTTFIPYPYWRFSHKFIGLFYGMGVFHFAFIQKPFDNLDPLGLYILSFCTAGVLAYLYMVLVYLRWPGAARYEVAEIIPFHGASEIVMRPVSGAKGIRHRAGQFAFFEFDEPGFREIHPFTISCAPTDGRELRICVKGLGGYTEGLIRALQTGTPVRVFGAFGRFALPKKAAAQIWVAGGVGITPFMAWARSLTTDHTAPIHLHYLLRSEEGAPFVDELKSIAAANPALTLSLHASSKSGRFDVNEVIRSLKTPMNQAAVSYCGPETLRADLKKACLETGLKKSRFHYEEFEIRSGIGFLAFATWCVKKFG